MAQLQTEIHIVEGHAEGLVQTAYLVVLFPAYQEAGPGHGSHILGVAKPPHIAQMHFIILVMRMPGRPVSTQTNDNARVLNRIVRVIELCSYRGHVRPLGVHQKLLHPLPCDDLHVVIQQKHIFSIRKGDAKIIDAGIVEVSLILHNPNLRIMLQRLVIIKNLFRLAVILHDDNFVILIGGFIDDRFHAAGQIFHMILIRDHNRDQRTLQKRVTDPEYGRKSSCAFYLRVHAIDVHNVIVDGPLGRVHRIGFRIDVLSYRRLMRSPVIESLRHMIHVFRLRSQAKDHIVVLASVILAAEYAGLVQQMSGKSRKMTDIIIAAQIVNRVIRLKMKHNHMIDAVALKGDLIAVNIICSRLVDHLRILIEYGGMQNIIMVKKSDIIACSQLQTLICIA